MRLLLSFLVLLLLGPGAADAQTCTGSCYGVLTTPPNTGPGGSCCSTVATKSAAGQQVPNDGSCAGCSIITSGQYAAYFAGLASDKAASYPVQYAAHIAAGIALTSTGVSALNGTYPLDPNTVANIQGLYIRAGATGATVVNFAPGGGTTVTLFDMSHNPHVFDAAHIQKYGDAVAMYMGQLTPESVAALGWPANNQVTIP